MKDLIIRTCHPAFVIIWKLSESEKALFLSNIRSAKHSKPEYIGFCLLVGNRSSILMTTEMWSFYGDASVSSLVQDINHSKVDSASVELQWLVQCLTESRIFSLWRLLRQQL